MREDKRRAMKEGLKKKMRKQVNDRTCPKCGRKGAISTHRDDLGVVKYCRYKNCDYERGWIL